MMKKYILPLFLAATFATSVFCQSKTDSSAAHKVIETEQQKIDLIFRLGEIHSDDQNIRKKAIAIAKEFGKNSKQYEGIPAKWKAVDSINLHKLECLIDTFGFETLIKYGEDAVFFVIQHAELAIQQKYLAKMKEAANQGTLELSRLAMFEDRILLRSGKKQIYGTQVILDPKTGTYLVRPLEEPETVNLRRMSVGLSYMSEYMSAFNSKWNIADYKKRLPEIEELEEELNTKN